MEKNYLCQEPIVYTINNVLTPEECEHFINVSKSDLKRAEVAGNNGGFISTGDGLGDGPGDTSLRKDFSRVCTSCVVTRFAFEQLFNHYDTY